VWGGQKFPPKEVIREAHRLIYGKPPRLKFSGGSETNNFLMARGFEIVDKENRPVGRASAVKDKIARGSEDVDKKDRPAGRTPEVEDEASSFPEGKKKYLQHIARERDTEFAKKLKKQRLSENGALPCEVCGFCFLSTYGPHGAGYIEAHHTVPVSEISGRWKTKASEIALVCSNCHRMLHRSRPWLEMGKLTEILKKQLGKN
jgi:predicted HNH restriction endonuclease